MFAKLVFSFFLSVGLLSLLLSCGKNKEVLGNFGGLDLPNRHLAYSRTKHLGSTYVSLFYYDGLSYPGLYAEASINRVKYSAITVSRDVKYAFLEGPNGDRMLINLNTGRHLRISPIGRLVGNAEKELFLDDLGEKYIYSFKPIPELIVEVNPKTLSFRLTSEGYPANIISVSDDGYLYTVQVHLGQTGNKPAPVRKVFDARKPEYRLIR